MNEDAKQDINHWYQKYSQDIFHYIFFLIKDRDLAKDLLQDTFLKAYRKHHTFKKEHEKSWLFKIARNVTIDFIRKKHPVGYLMDTLPAHQRNENTPELSLAQTESEEQLYQAINQLKRSYRDVILLRKIKELTVKETSEILNWKEDKVRVTLSRALHALKRQLEKEGYQHEAL